MIIYVQIFFGISEATEGFDGKNVFLIDKSDKDMLKYRVRGSTDAISNLRDTHFYVVRL